MFSIGGNIITISKRNCLKPENVERLIFLSYEVELLFVQIYFNSELCLKQNEVIMKNLQSIHVYTVCLHITYKRYIIFFHLSKGI